MISICTSPKPEPLYQYILVRKDLLLEDICPQVGHAAGESARLAPDLPPNTHIVILAVPDEATLTSYEIKLVEAGLRYSPIREPDAPYNGALTAIGIEPQARSKPRKILSNLPLLKLQELFK